MNSQELAFRSALEHARLIREGEISPIELVRLYLERIERLNPAINAFITVTAELALETARAAEARRGEDGLPPFWGVPISIKDLDDTAGVVTTKGSAAYRSRVPNADDRPVRLLKQAGFVMLGKTNTPEFGIGPFTDPLGYGSCRNPWDPSRTAGGSSGGAAAALAAGLCPISQGSDAGGSIRTPAAACGVVGLKPSRGRVSAAPAAPSLLAQVGSLTRTVADTAAALDVLAVRDLGDAWYAPPPKHPFLEEVGRPAGRLRIAFTADPPYEPVEVAASNRAAVEGTARWLEALGHDVVERAPRWPGDELNAVFQVVAAGRFLVDELPPPEDLEPATRRGIALARTLSLEQYARAQDRFQAIARELAALFEECDVLVTPTLAVKPPPAGALQAALVSADPAHALAELRSFFPPPFTRPWNVTGQPAISLPLHSDSDGLPVGVQLVGRPGHEATLLRVAAQLEAAHPWRDRRPALS